VSLALEDHLEATRTPASEPSSIPKRAMQICVLNVTLGVVNAADYFGDELNLVAAEDCCVA
jgi:hypothetical protein